MALLHRIFKISQTVAYLLATIVVVMFFVKFRNYNGEVYTPETDYIRWVTPLPAFTACPSVNRKFIAQQLKRYSKASSLHSQNISFFFNLLQPGKVLCPECPVRLPLGLPSSNFSELIQVLTPPCESQLLECSWNGLPFSCCQHFHPLVTRRGICFSFNSEQTQGDSGNLPFHLVTSHFFPEAVLFVKASSRFTIHVTDRKAVTFHKHRFNIPTGQKGEIDYKFTETVAQDSAWELKEWQRHCTLDMEYNVPGFLTNSYSACRTRCLVERQLQLCGCRHYLLQAPEEPCDLNGMLCLDQKLKNLTKPKCPCKKDCTGQEVQFVYLSVDRSNESNAASAVVKLVNPPTTRLVYYAQITTLETLVGFACATRLITSVNLHDVIIALLTMFKDIMRLTRLLRPKRLPSSYHQTLH